MMHAEQNAIVNAARIGVSTKGCTMYMTCGMPCADCAKAIINAGIEKIVIEPNGTGSGAKDGIWTEHGLRSITMFIEAGMTIEYYGDKS
jgi:dCMP deaminase